MRVRRGEVTDPYNTPGPRVDISLTMQEARDLYRVLHQVRGKLFFITPTTKGPIPSNVNQLSTMIDRVRQGIKRGEPAKGESMTWPGFEPEVVILDKSHYFKYSPTPVRDPEDANYYLKKQVNNLKTRINALELKQAVNDGRNIPNRLDRLEKAENTIKTRVYNAEKKLGDINPRVCEIERELVRIAGEPTGQQRRYDDWYRRTFGS